MGPFSHWSKTSVFVLLGICKSVVNPLVAGHRDRTLSTGSSRTSLALRQPPDQSPILTLRLAGSQRPPPPAPRKRTTEAGADDPQDTSQQLVLHEKPGRLLVLLLFYFLRYHGLLLTVPQSLWVVGAWFGLASDQLTWFAVAHGCAPTPGTVFHSQPLVGIVYDCIRMAQVGVEIKETPSLTPVMRAAPATGASMRNHQAVCVCECEAQ